MEEQKIAKRMKTLREKNGLSITDLAKILSVNTITIKKWESAKTTPHIFIFIKFAELYNVKLDYLLGLSD